ncbi:ATP-binding protein [bacterium]|nr:ATP-binding protein [bacterium]
MKLEKLRLRNFRCYQEETEISFKDFTAIIGKNDAGKSTLLDALALFFGEYKLDSDDASVNGDKKDVRIICEFSELPEEIVIDADNATTLKNEYLLNSSSNFEIHKIFDGSLATPKAKGVFAYANHPSKDRYKDLLYLKLPELKTRAKELGIDLKTIDQRKSAEIRKKIWSNIPNIELKQCEIDLDKENAKKIWNVLSKQLPIYAIFHSDRKSTDQDDEAQSPIKTAIKEAIKAKEDELKIISDYIEKEVLNITNDTIEKIKEIDADLAGELNPRFSKPNWPTIFKVSLTDDESIPINKRGSGIRRMILLNFFRAQAEKRLKAESAPGIIYAVEEPETSQHPSNQKLLLEALQELSEQLGCQVIITTHTPVLVKNLPLNSLIFVSKENSLQRINSNDEETYRKIADSLGVIPDHNVKIFIGVEGINDINFLLNMSLVLKRDKSEIVDLKVLQDKNRLIFVPLGGSNLSHWTNRLDGLNIPEIHIYDRDEKPPAISCHQSEYEEVNAKENGTAYLTEKREMENYIHENAIKNVLNIDIISNDFTDVPEETAKALHILNGGQGEWNELDEKKKKKKISQAKKRLNNEVVKHMNLQLLNEKDPMNEILGWFNRIKEIIDQENA